MTEKRTPTLLSVQQLGKRYRRDFWGAKEIELELRPGITGLLGPNGAGKSTLMRMLATITRPSSGEIFWNGENVRKNPNLLRRVLGYLPQDFGIYPHLNAVEFLSYLAAIKGIPASLARERIDALLVWLNLQTAARQPLSSFSGGMRQRVGIAQALLNDPLLLIVDEPTVGLDPEERVRFRELLTELSNDRIVLLSTHIVSDVETSADRIVIMDKGRIIQDGKPDSLIHDMKNCVWESQIAPEELVSLKERYLVTSSARRNGKVEVRVVSNQQPFALAKPVAPTLEDVYLVHIHNSGQVC